MAHNMNITFIGTTSGGGPTETRNCSSLVLDALGNGSLWMVDCAEGTVRQFAQQPSGDRRLRMARLTKIFITHMHADHTMGLSTVLRNILGIPKTWPKNTDTEEATTSARPTRCSPRVEVYGPMGIRSFVRTIFNVTSSRSEAFYCVHELLRAGETPSVPCEPPEVLHQNETPGRDIYVDSDGFWRDISSECKTVNGARVTIDAGPIVHRDPCFGYVFREHPRPPPPLMYAALVPTPPSVPRTVVILGDTSDASALIPLLQDDQGDQVPVSLLVHEATDAYIPTHIDKYGTTGRNRTPESVKEKAIEKGHSTPAMAGAFAKAIGAERLVLNHIGSRFPAPPEHTASGGDRFRAKCIREIERQANETWKPPRHVSCIAAWDFCTVDIPPNSGTAGPSAEEVLNDEDISAWVDATEDIMEVAEGSIEVGEMSDMGVRSQSVSVIRQHLERRQGKDADHARGEGGSRGRPGRGSFRGRGGRGTHTGRGRRGEDGAASSSHARTNFRKRSSGDRDSGRLQDGNGHSRAGSRSHERDKRLRT